jgi:purine catabolism regulator
MATTVTIKDLLKLKEFQTADIISTPVSLKKSVGVVTIMDLPTIDEWLKEDELLIMGFYMDTHFNRSFIEKLGNQNAAGIITKKKFKKNITPDLVNALQQANIPVLIVEDRYSWSDITAPIQSLIIRHQTTVLKETERFHQAMIHSLSNQHSFHDLCTTLHHMTGLSLAITDEQFRILDYSNDFDWSDYVTDLISHTPRNWQTIAVTPEGRRKDGFIEQRSTWPNTQLRLFLLPVYQNQQLVNYLVVKQPASVDSLPLDLLAKLESFQSIYLLKKAFYTEFQKANSHYQNLILEELIRMDTPNDEERKQLSVTLGVHLEKNYRVLLVKNLNEDDSSLTIERNDRYIAFRNNLKQQSFMNDNILVFSRKDYLVFLLAESFKQTDLFLNQLVDYLDSYNEKASWALGISDLNPYWQLHTGWKEAQQALHFIRSNTSSQRIQYYQNLGILKMFANDQGQLNTLYVQQMLSDYLAPILANDAKQHSQLYKTLETFFETNFSHISTSKILYIHKNTLRARLKRIEELLKIDLKNTDHLMNIHIALKLYQMMDGASYQKFFDLV